MNDDKANDKIGEILSAACGSPPTEPGPAVLVESIRLFRTGGLSDDETDQVRRLIHSYKNWHEADVEYRKTAAKDLFFGEMIDGLVDSNDRESLSNILAEAGNEEFSKTELHCVAVLQSVQQTRSEPWLSLTDLFAEFSNANESLSLPNLESTLRQCQAKGLLRRRRKPVKTASVRKESGHGPTEYQLIWAPTKVFIACWKKFVERGYDSRALAQFGRDLGIRGDTVEMLCVCIENLS